jgi:excisionase family DNA binding protein
MTTILTVQEVAERMRCEHRTVRRAIRSGELEAALIGGKWLVREEAVEAWFRARCAVANPFALPPRARRPRNDSRRPEVTGSVERLRAIERSGA